MLRSKLVLTEILTSGKKIWFGKRRKFFFQLGLLTPQQIWKGDYSPLPTTLCVVIQHTKPFAAKFEGFYNSIMSIDECLSAPPPFASLAPPWASLACAIFFSHPPEQFSHPPEMPSGGCENCSGGCEKKSRALRARNLAPPWANSWNRLCLSRKIMENVFGESVEYDISPYGTATWIEYID